MTGGRGKTFCAEVADDQGEAKEASGPPQSKGAFVWLKSGE
jgi:hypothetical protein